ncbi:hypothetical protein DW993_17185 [Clostridium sp. AM51-4]|mgnify:FL=1|nr:hypothetical protein DW993_17185 [Clostridium sp. AM51-4]
MRTLKKSIWSYMYKVTFALVSVILISITALNIANEQSRAQGTADKIFEQMDKMLEENQKELTSCARNMLRNVFIIQRPLPIFWRRTPGQEMICMNCVRSRNLWK